MITADPGILNLLFIQPGKSSGQYKAWKGMFQISPACDFDDRRKGAFAKSLRVSGSRWSVRFTRAKLAL